MNDLERFLRKMGYCFELVLEEILQANEITTSELIDKEKS